MKTIPSFVQDHDKIGLGVKLAREDKVGWFSKVTTWEIRVRLPNREQAMTPQASHTIEHIAATILRNSAVWGDKTVYFGPMGCLTGFYLVVKGKPFRWVIERMVRVLFEDILAWEGNIPGARRKQCGNFRLHDLRGARRVCYRFLKHWKRGN